MCIYHLLFQCYTLTKREGPCHTRTFCCFNATLSQGGRDPVMHVPSTVSMLHTHKEGDTLLCLYLLLLQCYTPTRREVPYYASTFHCFNATHPRGTLSCTYLLLFQCYTLTRREGPCHARIFYCFNATHPQGGRDPVMHIPSCNWFSYRRHWYSRFYSRCHVIMVCLHVQAV